MAMRDTRIIFVEGIMGAGKSTTAWFLYFYHADVARALRMVCDARGSEWEAYQVNWKVGSPFGVQRSLSMGFDGLLQLYQIYRDLCDDLFAKIALPKLAICNEGDWARYYRDILAFVGLPVY